MLPREVEYARPATIDEAIVLLSAHDGAIPLAGGQTLINVMKARVASPEVLVDLGDLDELRTVSFSDDGVLELGAMVTLSRLVASSEVDVARPILAEVAVTVADAQVRNRGTVGGNVCVNDPTNHLPPLLVALGATMTVLGADGTREVPADEFFIGVYMTAVGPGELLTKISVPPQTGDTGDGFEGVSLGRDGTFVANAAASVSNGTVRITLGCVDAVPVRATAMEEALAAGDFSLDAVKAAAAGLGATLDPPSDVHASADYRRRLAEVSAARAVLSAAGRRKG